MDLLIYNCFLFLYRMGVWLISPWNPKAKLWIKGRRDWESEIRDWMDKNPATSVIWMHCASLGEFEQGRPVIERFKQQIPNSQLLITFFSPSGYEIRKDYKGADIVSYLPMDSAANAGKFLNMVKPKLVVWVKYEYWYYYITEIGKRNIPLLLISGIFREGQPFFKWYGSLYKKMLPCFTHLFVQNEASLSLLKAVGIDKVTVSGDTRFDRVIEIAEKWEPVQMIKEFCGDHPVIVAGSTWPEDEEELDHYANTHPEIRFIIAPHEISEEHLKDIEKLFKNTVRYSQLLTDAGYGDSRPRVDESSTEPDAPSAPVRTGYAAAVIYPLSNVPLQPRANEPNTLIIDNIGMLSRLYKYATITYVGGGFGEDGVHNVLESAVYGKPVVYGPEYDKYREAVELIEAEGAFSVNNALELEAVLNRLLQEEDLCKKISEASKEYVYTRKGATDKVLRYIQEKRLLIN